MGTEDKPDNEPPLRGMDADVGTGEVQTGKLFMAFNRSRPRLAENSELSADRKRSLDFFTGKLRSAQTKD